MKFGERLKFYRKQKGITQKDLATFINVGQTTIANYESDKRFPNKQNLVEIANLLEISVDQLLGTELSSDKGINYTEMTYSEFEMMMLGHKFKDVTTNSIRLVNKGMSVLAFYENYIVPFMYKIGEDWQEGKIDISTERIMSNEILSVIHALVPFNYPKTDTDNRVLLMTIDQEFHMIALRIVNELFRHYGWRTFLIGNNIPWHSVVDTIKKERIGYLAISLTNEFSFNSVKSFTEFVRQHCNVKILVGGQAVERNQNYASQLIADEIMTSIRDLEVYIDRENNLRRN